MHSRSGGEPGAPPVSGWRGAFLLLRFLTELALLAVLAVVGAGVGSAAGAAATVALAVAAPLVVAGVWAMVMAPRSANRLPDPPRLLVELVLFVGSGAALVVQGHVVLGAAFAVIAGAAAVLARFLVPEA